MPAGHSGGGWRELDLPVFAGSSWRSNTETEAGAVVENVDSVAARQHAVPVDQQKSREKQISISSIPISHRRGMTR